ncbi:hypothetical protein K1567_27415 [Pseudomonas sp. S5F11]|uniref:hypothetical protein n=1 Tax=Pseudomonas sp. S5F11 TaxID=2866385 RepID=UPI001C7DB20B|nr:hypothetical protein [Pseudomonas sp. S5F11]MBX4139617.1 hypothetical protein [Pseudomonas sp. S5F11]
MTDLPVNDHGVPLYPKGHAGRLFVTMAAIDALDNPTAASVAALTGLSKGNIDTYVAALNSEMGAQILKEGPVYRIESGGQSSRKQGLKRC